MPVDPEIVRAMVGKGRSGAQIAEALGCSVATVYKITSKHKIRLGAPKTPGHDSPETVRLCLSCKRQSCPGCCDKVK